MNSAEAAGERGEKPREEQVHGVYQSPIQNTVVF